MPYAKIDAALEDVLTRLSGKGEPEWALCLRLALDCLPEAWNLPEPTKLRAASHLVDLTEALLDHDKARATTTATDARAVLSQPARFVTAS